ncbi:MAG: NUDIX domain-containing protein [Caldilineaceae bacterium]
MEITRHFTSTVLIVHRSRVLLHLHKKFGTLLPVGGHVDRDELPEEAALREVKEETGLSVQLYNPDPTLFPDVRLLIRPVHMLLININPYHQHIDFIYYATTRTEQVEPQLGESNQLHWYTREEILTAKMPENVRILALEALALLGETSL